MHTKLPVRAYPIPRFRDERRTHGHTSGRGLAHEQISRVWKEMQGAVLSPLFEFEVKPVTNSPKADKNKQKAG